MTVLKLYNLLGSVIAAGHADKKVDLFGTGRMTKLHIIDKTDRVILCDSDTEDSVGPNGEVIL